MLENRRVVSVLHVCEILAPPLLALGDGAGLLLDWALPSVLLLCLLQYTG